ncbi:gephyrin-like molybdotransferase Glp [Flagellimonas sp. DF-77]|uniref:molybdopterin molybdotransferase MoeA n=1 Tax=Flagellimonas algarum TaxID=3230298 RepID=UPI003398CC7D
MIEFEEAFSKVMQTAQGFGTVEVPLEKAHGRVLAENILADRDFPPFDRVTRDGIAIRHNPSNKHWKVTGIAAAGSPQQRLENDTSCLEVMTGAILPKNADTVVMYEHITLSNGEARLLETVEDGQNIHQQGSDAAKGTVLIREGKLLTAAEIGVLASVGASTVKVHRNPRICLFSTGDELVSIEQNPEPHQIRRSNAHTMRAALLKWGVASEICHVKDDKSAIQEALARALAENEAILISGGVSKGKYDHLPEVLENLGVVKHFHKVKQRPGKPFWFGKHPDSGAVVFGFPGNPSSTFVNFHRYFRPWYLQSLEREEEHFTVSLKEGFDNPLELTRFIHAKATNESGKLTATLIHGNGSGDLTSLAEANGFVRITPKTKVSAGTILEFTPTRRIL